MKILVLGASGMIGSTVLRVLSEQRDWEVFGTVRDISVKRFFSAAIGERLIAGVDVENPDLLVKVLDQIRPDVVVNCAGLTKHKPEADDPLVSIPINTLMPHPASSITSNCKWKHSAFSLIAGQLLRKPHSLICVRSLCTMPMSAPRAWMWAL